MSAEPASPPELPELPELPPVAPAGRSRRRVALGAAALLVGVAAAGGVGYAVLSSDGSGPGRAAPAATTPWSAPSVAPTKAFGAKSGGSHYGSLRLLLLPMPDDYRLGPDVDDFGNDVVLSAKDAAGLVKDDAGDEDASAKDRKRTDALVDALHIEGAGLRTYAHDDSELVADIALVQMANKQAAQAQTAFFAQYTKAMGVFRAGPKVPGHPQATCVLPPTDEDADKKYRELDMMICQATEGDLMVTMTATGITPLEKADAADLLRRQLDRIKDPGEAV